MYPSKVYYVFSYLHCDHQQRYVSCLEMALAGFIKLKKKHHQNTKCLVKCFHVFYLFTYIFNERNAANIL